MQTTFVRLLLEHATQRPARAGAAREGIRHLADAELGASWPRSCAISPAASRQAGLPRGEHVVVVGDNRPRLYASMLAAQTLGGDSGAAVPGRRGGRVRVPARQRRGRASRSSRTRSRSTSCSRCAPQCPRLGRIWYDDPRGLRNYEEPGLASLDALVGRGLAFDAHAARACSRPRSRSGAARRRGGDVLHLGHHRQPEGRRAHPRHADRPRGRRRALRQAHRERRGAGLPAAGLDRPEHLQLRAVAGVRLRRQLPGVGEHGDDRPARRSARPTTSRRRGSSKAC